MLPPENECRGSVFIRNSGQNLVGHQLPALTTVRTGCVLLDGQNRVEEQNSLLCPIGQVARLRRLNANVGLQFFQDVS